MNDTQSHMAITLLERIAKGIDYQNKLQETLLETIDGKSKQSHMDKNQLQENISNLLSGMLKNSGSKISASEIMSHINKGMGGNKP